MKKGIDYIGVSAGVMVFNDKGELFLSKRSQNVSNERGCWETPSGGVEFTAITKGTIAKALWGDRGFGFDSIFIPKGYEVTMAEDIEVRDMVSPFNSAMLQFAEWYKGKLS
tara:strand:+ start:163 stop:495 length:333 start_codon:yes stop_codon:yes gene_type:complete